VTDRSGFSVQTLSVLAALCAEPAGWRHRYGIAKDTGLESGGLYPILIRLAERGLAAAAVWAYLISGTTDQVQLVGLPAVLRRLPAAL
jgi:hypothetical protein